MVFKAEGVGKQYGERWIFRSLSFQVETGTVLALTGRNGSGKSTLLKCISGLLPLTEGSVEREEPIGFAGLDLALYPTLSGREHLKLFGAVDPDKELEAVSLLHAADLVTSGYSTGMRARLKLALALSQNPKLLILDEPTAALDVEGRKIVENLIAKHRENGAVILATNVQEDLGYATHELNLG
ncbi:MAG: ABC transporter ATP-binding protein [Armatimonadetes bacterium]|nr:ABC transporter ATP-binding protein [Armatimonadota bacterium]